MTTSDGIAKQKGLKSDSRKASNFVTYLISEYTEGDSTASKCPSGKHFPTHFPLPVWSPAEFKPYFDQWKQSIRARNNPDRPLIPLREIAGDTEMNAELLQTELNIDDGEDLSDSDNNEWDDTIPGDALKEAREYDEEMEERLIATLKNVVPTVYHLFFHANCIGCPSKISG